MPEKGLKGNLKLSGEVLRKRGQDGLPLRLRLLLFLFLFLSTIMVGVFLILFLTGVFKVGRVEHRSVLESELKHLTGAITETYSGIAVQAVDLAKELALSMEKSLWEQNVSINTLQQNPDLLERLLHKELGKLTNALEKSRSSGVFVILDATINPSLPGAEYSRSCVYLNNTEPNIVNQMSAYLSYRIGPIGIARSNSIRVLPQWQMELDVSQLLSYARVLNMAKERKHSLSRLYYWSESTSLPGSSERFMLCMVPLIASNGTVFGVCGFEVSEMLFKLSYSPKAEKYDQLLFLFTPVKDNALALSGALFGGHFAASPEAPVRKDMKIVPFSGGFSLFKQGQKDSFVGLQQTVSLYPVDSAFADSRWKAALMMPRQRLEALTSGRNPLIMLGFLFLTFADIALAVWISSRFISPVVGALEQLKKPDQALHTKIPEIDDLIEFLTAQDEAPALEKKKVHLEQEHSSLYLEFKKNIATLSVAEKRVFDLYVKGHTAQEIAEILYLSINTVKTHNRRIYIKLNVSSRNELMVYVRMMEEAGYFD